MSDTTTDTGGGRISGMGIGMGMGMGMGMGPGGFMLFSSSPQHTVYGNSLIGRHEWIYTVDLVDFLMNSDWQTKINVNDPPADDSAITKDELNRLKNMQEDEQEVASRYDDIIAEVDEYLGLFENLCFFDAHTHPHTTRLIQSMDLIGWTVVQHYKAVYKRVRPNYLEPTIKPVIRVPTFPAYPSGHATQAHLLKNVLIDVLAGTRPTAIEMKLRSQLERLADTIARNREWAGVHYKSDSDEGEKLADQTWTLAKRMKSFDALLDKAKAEWQ